MPYTIATTTSGVNLTTSEISAQASAFKTALSLGAVNNTADVDKPISTAQQAALDLKMSKSFVSELLYSPASLDFAFADDKSFTRNVANLSNANSFLLTARKGPSLTYTRATGATTFDADGLVKYSPENLLNFSESFATSGGTNNTWADTNFTRAINYADPIGGFTAIRFTANAPDATVISSAAIGASDLRTFSFWMRRVTGSGAVSYTIDGGATYTAITALTTSWTRFSYTATADHRVGFKVNTNADAIEIWGAQLERSLVARQYLSTTSSVVYGPRFWHDPRSLTSRGLLLELASTNICWPSNTFSSWTLLRTSLSASNTSATLDPAGTNTADVILETTDNDTHSFQLSIAGANIANATRYTFSCFVKPIGRTFCALSAFPGSTNGATGRCAFSLSGAGSIITPFTPSDATPTIVAFPNGWYRVSMSTTATTSGGVGGVVNITIGADSNCGSYGGDITKGLYVYGAQVEAGLRASTYIPTTTAPVLRAKADCRLEGNDFASIYNQSEGTVKLTVQPLDPTNTTLGLFGIEVNSRPDGSMAIGTNGLGTFIVELDKQSYADVATYTTSWSLSSPTSVAFAYKSNNCNAAFNGVSQTAITNTTLGSALMVRMALGANGITSGPQSGSGLFSRLTIYKSRISNEYLKIATS
jgi:hypothetical protein